MHQHMYLNKQILGAIALSPTRRKHGYEYAGYYSDLFHKGH